MPSGKNTLLGAVVVAALAAETFLASRARPFTWPADVITAIALLALGAVVIVQYRRGRVTSSLIARRSTVDLSNTGHPWGLRWTIWIAPAVGIAVWELYSYLGSPRTAHPTLSSMLDTLTASHVGRGSAFIAWLVLGWYLVTR